MLYQSSLSTIGATIREQLRQEDITTGEEYVKDLFSLIEPTRARLATACTELGQLVEQTAAAKDTVQLLQINDLTVQVASELFAALQSVPIVQQLCSTARDAIAERALELSRQELYFSGTYCELPLALLSVGSDGRKEQTLFTDQDYLFLYGPGMPDSCSTDEAQDEYFGMLGSVFANKMEEAGISRCSGGIMPVNEDWRGTPQQWQERLTSMFRFEKSDWERNILNLIALMDTRFVCGDQVLGLGFGKEVRSRVRGNSQAIQQMARVVSSMKLSKGFLRRFVTEAEGIHKGEFNLKLLAWMPLVMCIRLLSVDVGIEETATLRRIRKLGNDGHLTDKLASELTGAYHRITGLRITQQMKRIKRVIDDDCYINPYELPNAEREGLKNAIGSIDELQNMVRSRFSISASVDHILLPRL